jgi:hypothetical protein
LFADGADARVKQRLAVSKTQFVKYANRCFWAYDVALGVFLKHLIDAAEASGESDTAWLSSAVPSWRRVACISDFALMLDENWPATQRETFVVLAETACTRLATRESITADEIVGWPLLEDLRIFPRGAKEVHTAPVVELGRAIIALVSGELPEEPKGETWLYGTPTGRCTLRTLNR